MMRSSVVFIVWGVGVVALGAGCAGPAPAPKDLDGLAQFFFAHFHAVDDEGNPQDPSISDTELQDAITKLHKVIDGDALAEPSTGTLDNLTPATLATTPVKRDPQEGQGMFAADIVHCTLDQQRDNLLTTDQLSLYPEAYASYARAYDAGTPENFPTWTVTYTSSQNALVQNQFTAHVKTGLRTVPVTDHATHGEALVRAGFLPQPATFESEGSEFTFDFQVETYHERKPGEIVHFYAMWRYMRLGVLGDSYDQVFIDQTLQGMTDWDQKTDALCAQ